MKSQHVEKMVLDLPLAGPVTAGAGALLKVMKMLLLIEQGELDLGQWQLNTQEGVVGRIGILSLEEIVSERIGLEADDQTLIGDYTISPGGELTLQRRSWTKTQSEFKDSFSELAEEELQRSHKRNSEMASVNRSEEGRDIGLNIGLKTGGKYGLPGNSSSYEASLNADYKTSRKEASTTEAKRRQEGTQSAASRAREEHNLEFTVATDRGLESSVKERYNNPSRNQWVRLQLFKIFAKWVTTHRIKESRLLLEVAIADPGKRLREEIDDESFDVESVPAPDPDNPPPGAPPVPENRVEVPVQVVFFGDEPAGRRRSVVGRAPDPDVYILESIWGEATDGGDALRIGDARLPIIDLAGNPDINSWHAHGYTRVLIANWDTKAFPNGKNDWWDGYEEAYLAKAATLRFVYRVREGWLAEWQQRAMGAQTEDYRRVHDARSRVRAAERDLAEAASSVPHTQRLRKEEREELFSGALDWLQKKQLTTPGSFDEAAVDDLFKLFPAFEWEGASTILYPWWWDASRFDGQELTIRQLSHPDLARESFIKASWGRVLIPVRLGHEQDFMKMVFPDDQELVELLVARAVQKAVAAVKEAGGDAADAAHPLIGVVVGTSLFDLDLGVVDGYFVDALTSLLLEQGYFADDGEGGRELVRLLEDEQIVSSWVDYLPTDHAEARVSVLAELPDSEQAAAMAIAELAVGRFDEDATVSRVEFGPEGTTVEL